MEMMRVMTSMKRLKLTLEDHDSSSGTYLSASIRLELPDSYKYLENVLISAIQKLEKDLLKLQAQKKTQENA